MICEKCGTVYAGNFCPNGCNSPNAQKANKKPLYKKWWFWVLVVLAVFWVIGSTGENENSSVSNEPQEMTAAVDSADFTIAEETTPVHSESTPQTIYYPGDTIDNDDLLVTYVSAEVWDGYSDWNAPQEGFQYIRLMIQAENTSDSDAYISSWDFDCYADGSKVENSYYGDDVLNDGTLSTGRRAAGYIYFEVPMDAAEIEVEYELNIFTDKRAILKVSL